ncbi:MAG: calcium-binding protein, partial [Alphaproteobacteria bacterium]
MVLDPDFFTYLNIYNGPWLAPTPKLNGTPGNDDIVAGDRLLAIVLNGYGGDDRLTGGSGINTIFAGNGSDQLFGGAGLDTLYGSGGNDYLEGGKGGDFLSGGAGTNTLSYASSEEGVTIDLRPNLFNRITTATGGDAQGDSAIAEIQNVVGSEAEDNINGTNGANVIIGLGGVDVLLGNDGDDILSGGLGGDYIDGGQGIDTALYITSSVRVMVDLSLGSTPQGGSGEEYLDQLVSIENLTGSRYNDDLTGDAGANVLSGSSGDDFLTGRGGADTLDGGIGNDTAFYKEIDAGVTIDLRLEVQH